MSVLRTDNLRRSFGSLIVTNNVNLTIEPGERHVIIGPNGAGKTSFVNQVGGQLRPSGGRIFVKDTDITGWSPDQISRMGVARTFQRNNLFQNLSVLENLRVARGDVTPDEARDALGRAGLTACLDGLPDGVDTLLGTDAQNVSGGERRRLLLARALVAPAPLLLVDEPGEHLDRATADLLVRDLLTQGAAGAGVPARTSTDRPRGVVVVTHRLTPLDAADEVVLLNDGRVEARGTHAELLRTHDGYREAIVTEQDDDPEDA